MSGSFREERATLPENLADAATAVWVARNFRWDDVMAVAKQLAPFYETRWYVPPAELFTLIVGHLEHDGAKPAESVIGSSRRIELIRSGDTNVISVSIGLYQDGVVRARVLRKKDLVEEEQRARTAFYHQLTERPIENDNDPEPEFSRLALRGYQLPHGEKPSGRVSPGLWTRMVVKGLLARIISQPALRIRNGVFEGGAQ